MQGSQGVKRERVRAKVAECEESGGGGGAGGARQRQLAVLRYRIPDFSSILYRFGFRIAARAIRRASFAPFLLQIQQKRRIQCRETAIFCVCANITVNYRKLRAIS